MSTTPDFAALFPRPDDEEVERLEPRTAYALATGLEQIMDQIREDLEDFGTKPMEQSLRITQLPYFTWKQGRDWFKEIQRSATDLYNDLHEGRMPFPRNVAEEVVLYWAIKEAEGNYGIPELWVDDEVYNALPTEEEPFAEDDLLLMLYQDLDFMWLFDASYDGFEHDREFTQRFGTADYRAEAWFQWFGNAEPRDPGRPYLPPYATEEEPPSPSS